MSNQDVLFRAVRLAVTAALVAIVLGVPSRSGQADVRQCIIHPDLARLDHRLRHTGERLAAGEPLTIVAIGSSSTAGFRASSPAATYPARLQVELRQRFPHTSIAVLNRGVGGQEARDMLGRLDSSVFAAHPDLVIWQVGTNMVLRDRSLQRAARQIDQGLKRIKQRDIDIILIDPQYAPRVLAKPETPAMVALLAATAKEYNVDLFHRFELMRRWNEDEGIPVATFVSTDRLHMNDWGYACWAKVLGAAIANAVQQPVATAASRQLQRP